MPKPGMSNTPHRGSDSPTAKQLRLLRELALERGQSFTPPTSKAEASAEIRRLYRQPRQSVRERRLERVLLDRIAPPANASSVTERELIGYGSTARWANRPETRS